MSDYPSLTKARECSHDGCANEANGLMDQRCGFHRTIANARELSDDELGRLRDELSNLQVVTDTERHQRLINARLWSIKYHAEQVERDAAKATEAGASVEQINDAIANASGTLAKAWGLDDEQR